MANRPLRRSSRLSGKAIIEEPTRRPPIKNDRKRGQPASAVAVNGSEEEEAGSPGKKRRLETEEEQFGRGDENEMDVQEPAEEQEGNEDPEMDIGLDSSPPPTPPPIRHQDPGGDANLCKSPRVVLSELNSFDKETRRGKPSTEECAASSKSSTQTRSSQMRHIAGPKYTRRENDKRIMAAKDNRQTYYSDSFCTGMPAHNLHILGVNYIGEAASTARQRLNHNPTPINPKEIVHSNQQGKSKAPEIPKSTAHSFRGSFRGFIWHLWRLVLLLLLSSVVLLAYKIVPVLRTSTSNGELPSRAVNTTSFSHHFSLLQTRFANQQPELWKKGKIHLETHLKTAQPREPVSLILAAGLRAERTLRCLALGLASSFSSALNASVLHINGVSKGSLDSDEVKFDIDTQLRAAFGGDKPVAVIHRFDKLPPGSTLIFYRYCDHENAAYKRAFLLFTVLLPQDDISGDLSLVEVEELVQEYVKETLVGSGEQTAFNTMDMDKFGGLWSRISHLILPVAPEEEVEQKGC